MRKLICLLALAMAVALGAGCAKMPVRGDYMQDTPPQIVPDQESAVVYFLRESAFTGGGITYFIFEDDTKIGLLKSGSYFIHKATPGKHTYLAETESRAAVTLDIQPGQTYYIEGSIGMGFWAGRPQLTEITKPVADKLLPDLKYIRLATPEETDAYKQKEAENVL
ncbi:DUF2846 domain-containing protein [Desulfovibrio fairfieldensis]|uniref:DUF2846 domain-containing protein n=1 Tax=Desulfovibrio fairfieldensis TaxID=44742 RepID=A0A109W3Y6_9BACT|nr:DUF2846 domain-containing protein [Desulfovibrio fairfieldensis]AMD89480.1 hypothetical protein AXF13_04775 [Desulfovibrio fairfieldensis]